MFLREPALLRRVDLQAYVIFITVYNFYVNNLTLRGAIWKSYWILLNFREI